MTKIYKPNIKALAIVLAVPTVLIIVATLMDTSHIVSSIKGVGIFIAVMSGLLLLATTIKIKISDSDLLEYSYLFFVNKKARVKDIYQIDRASNYKGLGSAFGHQMFVYYKVDGQENVFAIGENSFDKKIIKKFINDLVKVNPNIQFDKYYRSLIND